MILRKLYRGNGLVKIVISSAVIFNIVILDYLICNSIQDAQKLFFSAPSTNRKDYHKARNEEKMPEIEVMTSNSDSSFLIPDDIALRKLTEAEQLAVYWKYINTVQVLCKNQTRVGKLGDGGKEMCTDDIYKPQRPCIVYSFGSNYQFDFDVPMNKFYGCDVFTYDPSMKNQSKPIAKEIKFELRGIAEKNYINQRKWKLSTLKQIVMDNKHENSIIDVLKIDVEGAEWKALPPAIEAGILKRVKQILIETHAGRMGPKRDKEFWGNEHIAGQLRVLRLLYEAGFRIFMRERNRFSITNLAVPPENQITTINEMSLININFKRKNN